MKSKNGPPKWRYKWINGRSRNEVVKLSPDELAAMASELQSLRGYKHQDHYDRRKEYVETQKKNLRKNESEE